MKELSIEEKAKRYDEAKLRMSAAYNSNRCTIGFMNEIFPELKESEDEKIRKGLLQFLNAHIGCSIAPAFCTQHIIKWIEWIENQGKQKPEANCLLSWSEEDERMFKSLNKLLNEASCYSCTEGVDKILSWFKSLKQRIQPQNTWKPTEEQLVSLKLFIEHYPDYVYNKELDDLYNDLKAL